MHLAVRFHIVCQLNDAGLLGHQRGANFVECPCEVISVVIERLIRVLTGVKTSARLIGKHGIGPIDNSFSHFAQKRIARDLIAVQKILQQLRIVVGHFFEVRDAPAFVHRIAVKAAGDLVVHAAGAHFFQRRCGHFQQSRAAAGLMPLQQQVERRWMRKFRRTSKASVARVEHIHDGLDLIVGHARIEFSARACECFRLRHCFR